jgi:hypothetical protein
MIKNFKANFADSEVTRVSLQQLFLRYDGAKSDADREKIIQEIDHQYVYGHYNHTKPADVKRKKDSKDNSSKKETQQFVQDHHFNEKAVLNEVYNNNSMITSLHKTLYNKVDFNKLSDTYFVNFMGNVDCYASISNPTFMDKLVVMLDQKYKTNKHFKLESYLYDRFTFAQLEDLGDRLNQVKEDSHYVGKMFEKKFHFELDQENKDSFTLEERRQQLIDMYDASENRPQSLKSALLLEILENGVMLDIFDKNFFLKYLKNPLKSWHMKKENNRPPKEIHDHVWSQYITNVHQRAGGRMDANLDKKLYKKHLEQFYISKGDLDDFKDYFDQDFLDSHLEEFEFLSGKDIKKEFIDANKFETLKNNVLIELLECNKDVFMKQDRVKLVVEIKNVPTLHIKVFEFNSENYYRKNLAPFRTDVNLDGLVTAHEEKHEFKEPSQQKFRHVFEFPQLDDKVGLFVIEFISNGFSSRAVIKKGSLSLIYKSTVAGQVAYILDENKQI